MTDRLLLTIPETAAELRVHTDTVYEWISRGRIRTVNIAEEGKRSKSRVERTELLRFIEASRDKRGVA